MKKLKTTLICLAVIVIPGFGALAFFAYSFASEKSSAASAGATEAGRDIAHAMMDEWEFANLKPYISDKFAEESTDEEIQERLEKLKEELGPLKSLMEFESGVGIGIENFTEERSRSNYLATAEFEKGSAIVILILGQDDELNWKISEFHIDPRDLSDGTYKIKKDSGLSSIFK